MANESEATELGRAAFIAGKTRQPMKDHALVKSLQKHGSENYHPMSPGANMSPAERRKMEKKLNDWKHGWDEAHKESKE